MSKVKSLQGSRQMRKLTSKLPALSSHDKIIPCTLMACSTLISMISLPCLSSASVECEV